MWVKPIWLHFKSAKGSKCKKYFPEVMWSKSGEEGFLACIVHFKQPLLGCWWKDVRWANNSVKHKSFSISVFCYSSSEKDASISCWLGLIKDDGQGTATCTTFFFLYSSILSPTPSSLCLKSFHHDCLLMSTQAVVFVHDSSFCRLYGLEGWVNMRQSELLSTRQVSSRGNTGTSTCTFHAQNWLGGYKSPTHIEFTHKTTPTSLFFPLVKLSSWLLISWMKMKKQQKSISCGTVAGAQIVPLQVEASFLKERKDMDWIR